MKGKYLPFLILPLFAILFFLFSPYVAKAATIKPVEEVEEVQVEEEEWKDSSKCVATCDSTEGKKTQTLYKWVCEKTCPTKEFSTSREVLVSEGYYEECPEGYTQDPEEADKCIMSETRYAKYVWVQTGRHSWEGNWVCPEDDSKYSVERHFWFLGRKYEKPCSRDFVIDTIDKVYVDPVYETETFGPIYVKYLFDSEAEVCSRPSADIIIGDGEYSWAQGAYNELMPVTMDLVETETCELLPTKTTRQVDCEAELVACPVEDTPEVLGELDTKEPVKETAETTVVLAETGASDNILVYIVQAVLMLSTLVSGTLFVKKYII